MATVVHCHDDARELLARLTSPERNRYFYGKLLDAHHFTLEQQYLNSKRWLGNRLTFGVGVVCGLEVEVSNDRSRIRVLPGFAIDGYGREIIVPEPSPWVAPGQPTDMCGQPSGAVVQGGPVTLSLCYYECDTEPSAALVYDCEPDRRCEYGLVRERYRLQVTAGNPPPRREPLARYCARLFGAPLTRDERRALLCEVVSRGCPDPDTACLPIAGLQLGDRGLVQVDPRTNRPAVTLCATRPVVLSNALLLELVLCLADRVDVCCGGGPVVARPPVITAVWPPNRTMLALGVGPQEEAWRALFLRRPRLELTFDRAMSAAALANPDPWLRVRVIDVVGAQGGGFDNMLSAGNAAQFPVQAVTLVPDAAAAGTLGAAGSTAVWGLRLPAPAQGTVSRVVLVMVDSAGNAITAAADPAELDAEFNDSLAAAAWPKLWNLGAATATGAAFVGSLFGIVPAGAPPAPAPALPSGDGTPGGRFLSAFLFTINP